MKKNKKIDLKAILYHLSYISVKNNSICSYLI